MDMQQGFQFTGHGLNILKFLIYRGQDLPWIGGAAVGWQQLTGSGQVI